MKLFTKAIERALPTNDATAHLDIDDLTVHVKLFNPTGIGTWWLYSYDPDTRIAYGLCDLGHPELGPVSLIELEDFRGRFGLGIERDRHFTPAPLREIMERVGA